jgi:hypothetical protein
MTIDGFLTLLSLIVAVFAVIPRFRQLEVKLHIRWWDLLLLAFWFLSLLYLQFYNSFIKLGLTPSLGLYQKFALTSDKVAYLLSLTVILYLIIILNFRSIGRGSIKRFQDLISELISDQKWAELFSVIEKRLPQIYKLYSGNFLISKIRRLLNPKEVSAYSHIAPGDLLKALNEGDLQNLTKRPSRLKVLDKLCDIWKFVASKVLRCVPLSEPATTKAHEIIEELFMSKLVVENLSVTRPYLSLEMIACPFRENRDFIELFLKSLHRNTKSIFYKEIRDNLNSDGRYRYFFPPKNRLLNALVANSVAAESLQVWRPIGESVINFLDEQRKLLTDTYCYEMGNYESEGKNECPIQNGIWFFDLMVTEAFHSDIEWHMWLYYFDHFSERIIRNLGEKKIDSDDRAYPTRYHFLLDVVVSTLCNWIEMVEVAKKGQKNATLERTSPDHENGNIPKSAILCLGSVIGKINGSDKINTEFKVRLVKQTFDLYFRLLSIANRLQYAEALARSLKVGGIYLPTINEKAHLECLENAFNEYGVSFYGDRQKLDVLRKILGIDENPGERDL